MGVQGLTEISVDAFQAPKTSIAIDIAIEARCKESHRCERLLRVVVAVPWWSPLGPCSPLVEEETDLERTVRRSPQQLDAETSSSQQVNPQEGRRRRRPGDHQREDGRASEGGQAQGLRCGRGAVVLEELWAGSSRGINPRREAPRGPA
jgi:hypothetical protein